MKLVLYFRQGCPFCQKVKDSLEDKDLDVKIYYVGQDFTLQEYKMKYGEDATFPRGFVVDGKNNHLLKDSTAILEFIDNEFSSEKKEEITDMGLDGEEENETEEESEEEQEEEPTEQKPEEEQEPESGESDMDMDTDEE